MLQKEALDNILLKEDDDSFKKKYNLLMDCDLNVQNISDKMTLSHNSKSYKLKGYLIQDIFTPNTTFVFNGKPAKQLFYKNTSKKNKDTLVTIVKKPEGEIINIAIFNVNNGDSVELVSVLLQSNLLLQLQPVTKVKKR